MITGRRRCGSSERGASTGGCSHVSGEDWGVGGGCEHRLVIGDHLETLLAAPAVSSGDWRPPIDATGCVGGEEGGGK